jgi:hypothetical protein
MRNYDESDWYWQKQDGGLYSSAQGDIEAESEGYQAFLAAGGRPTPFPKDAAGEESVAELFNVLSKGLEGFMDRKVKAERGYSGVDALAKYAIQSASPAYKAEAEAAAGWVASCWEAWFQIEAAAKASGTTASLAEMLGQMPPLAWPE